MIAEQQMCRVECLGALAVIFTRNGSILVSSFVYTVLVNTGVRSGNIPPNTTINASLATGNLTGNLVNVVSDVFSPAKVTGFLSLARY